MGAPELLRPDDSMTDRSDQTTPPEGPDSAPPPAPRQGQEGGSDWARQVEASAWRIGRQSDSDPLATLADVIRGLRRRAWEVHGGAALLFFAAASLLLVLLAALALGLGAPPFLRPLAFCLVGLAAAIALFHAWRRAGRPTDAALARLLEDRDPRAAGLSTAVELAAQLGSAPSGETDLPWSADLARAHVERTAASVAETGPDAAFDRRPLRIGWGAALGSLALLAVAAWLLPPVAPGLARLRGESRAAEGDRTPRLLPITGDVTLTYLYPAHTGLAPRTVEGTNGEIHAPAGTQVRIETRADRDLARALIEVDGASLPMEVKGRQLSGSLLVQRSGSYRFRFADGKNRTLAVGPEIPIVVVPDGPPAIDILAPISEMTVTEREAVEIRYEASDDYGVAAVELVFQVEGAAEEVVPLAQLAEPRRRTDGSYIWELSTLDLRPGDRVSYYLRAQDNDQVGGAKYGQSRTQVLHVFSAAEHRRALMAKVEEAWEGMVLALGDRIAPRQGPRAVQGPARIEAGRPADEQVLQVGTALGDLAGEFRKDPAAPEELTLALVNISRGLMEKGRVTRAARSRARASAVTSALLQALDRAEGAEQQELEKSVLYLEALLDRQRILQIEEIAREMAASRRELASLIERYRDAPSDAARQEILRELSRLRQRMQELMRRMAELSKGLQDEHLNAEAMQALAKERDLQGGLDEVERLLGEGKIDEALARLNQIGMELDEMAKALGEAADSQVQHDPALRELAEKMQRYEQELQALQQEQEELAGATERLRREQARHVEQRLSREGQRLVDELRAKVERARDLLARVGRNDLPTRLGEDLDGAEERLRDLDDALSVKDFDAALESAAHALAWAESFEANLSRELGYAERFDLPGREALEEALSRGREATPLVREVKEKLEEIFANPSQQLSGEQRQQLERLARRQSQLGERMRQLQQQAAEIGEQAPIFDESARQAMRDAEGAMGEASRRLRGLDPGGALAAERRAQEQLRSLQQGLERAKEQARGNGGGGGFPMPLAAGGGRGESGMGDFDGREKVAIPGADQYKAPEEFRKDILDAMKQEAPAPFREHVRDYYEEIVK